LDSEKPNPGSLWNQTAKSLEPFKEPAPVKALALERTMVLSCTDS